jgi:hypothetical protein
VVAPTLDVVMAGQVREGRWLSQRSCARATYDPLITETDHGSWRQLLALRYPFRYHKPGKLPAESGHYDQEAEAGLRERLRDGEGGRGEAVLAWPRVHGDGTRKDSARYLTGSSPTPRNGGLGATRCSGSCSTHWSPTQALTCHRRS